MYQSAMGINGGFNAQLYDYCHGTIHVTAAEPFFQILLYDAVTLRCPIVVPQILMNSVPIPIRILWLRLLISLYTSKSENPSPCHVVVSYRELTGPKPGCIKTGCFVRNPI
ncbi:hypothetical protein IW262DRAFT_1485068 [Armillaria fumosa]|nr:hypothetical protein IW262DRAFT_1485068 [Armillaria fumosa]